MKGSDCMDGKIAKRTDDVTDEEWATINKVNRDMVQDYLDNQSELSPRTKPAYKSGLRINGRKIIFVIKILHK